MSTPDSLHRLHELRKAEEEQRKGMLRKALGEVHELKSALKVAFGRLIQGHALLRQSLLSGELGARLSAHEEIAGSSRLVNALNLRISAAETVAEKMRDDLLAKRLERRQAAKLLASIIEREELQERRKTQAALDDWYRSRQAGKLAGGPEASIAIADNKTNMLDVKKT